MSNVVPFIGVSRLDTPPENVINGALEAEMEEVVIVGICKDGSFYLASSQADSRHTLYWLALAQQRLLETGDPE